MAAACHCQLLCMAPNTDMLLRAIAGDTQASMLVLGAGRTATHA